ncbi:MAG: FlgB family protein [Pseudomonadota bacterium]
MFDQLEILKMSHGLARNAAARQSAVAQNIANVNTPGYARVDVRSFADIHGTAPFEGTLRTTRSSHLDHNSTYRPPTPEAVRGASTALNGNSVSLEDEIVAAAELRQQHDMALTVYQNALTVLRTALGRG